MYARGSPTWQVTTFAQSRSARLAPRHGRHRGQLQLRLGDFQALGTALDVRLRQLQRLLVLDRGEDAQRAVVPARAQEPRALLAVKLTCFGGAASRPARKRSRRPLPSRLSKIQCFSALSPPEVIRIGDPGKK